MGMMRDSRTLRLPPPFVGEGWGGEALLAFRKLPPCPTPSPRGGGEATVTDPVAWIANTRRKAA